VTIFFFLQLIRLSSLFEVSPKDFAECLHVARFSVEVRAHKSEVSIGGHFVHAVVYQVMRRVVFEGVFCK